MEKKVPGLCTDYREYFHLKTKALKNRVLKLASYTAYLPKFRCDRGSVYGNATLQPRDYEPGRQRSAHLPGSAWRENYSTALPLHLGGTISNVARENAENWNNKNGYFNPASGKYHITQMRHILDGDPETTKAINAIEEIKYELRKPSVQMPSGIDRCDSLRKGLRTAGQPSQCVTGAQQLDKPATFRNEKMTKSIRNEFTGKERPTSLCTKEDYFQRRQGKIIYRTNGGLLPNYAGYIPGQMFLIGNTWGRDSFDAMGKHQNQKFQWTSLF
ncbi:uncharacterized protein [Hyperolius riggenbachi]|uniref:uncharacterized protein n=1 Tax=Hyperolius riggenbachi TaxID=752182 RepID=UPI0035A34BB1